MVASTFFIVRRPVPESVAMCGLIPKCRVVARDIIAYRFQCVAVLTRIHLKFDADCLIL